MTKIFKLLNPLSLALLLGIFWCQGSFAQTEGEDELSYRDQVQIMYVAYYGRPGDAGGLDFWAGKLEEVNGNLKEIINEFGNSMEFTDRFGELDDEELVDNIFLQLLGRRADSGGLNFYVNALREGRFTLASLALNVADGTQDLDEMIKINKLRAANAFSEALVEADAPYGEFQIDDAKLWLGEVDSTDASITAALDRLPDLLEMFSGGTSPETLFYHRSAFAQLPEDSRHFDEVQLEYPWYLYNYNFAKYVGYQDLLAKFDRHLPAGRGLTVLQAESDHTPDSAGNVLHLFDNPGSGTHSETVAGILTDRDTYPLLWTSYTTFSLYLDNFHASTTADLRTFTAGLGSGPTYPETSYDGAVITPAKLLNISNTNGSGIETMRHFDKFVEENDLVACTAMSGGTAGNRTTSGTVYNSIVVHTTWIGEAHFEGALVNDHGEPRYKPDMVTWSAGRASSDSTPTVCSAAAMLLERTQVDAGVANAYNSVATKAILMAGATRFNYRISSHWSNVQVVDEAELVSEPLFHTGEWERTSDVLSLSPKYGAGHLNVLAAYEILDAGEFDPGAGPVGVRGWDYAEGHAVGDTLAYPISLDRETVFSALLVWHRYIDDAFASHLPDYEISVHDNAGTRVAFSDNVTSNVELVEAKLAAGDYRVSIRVKSDGGSTDGLSYGLAWIGKEVLTAPVDVVVSAVSETEWTVSWEEQPDRRYRVSVGADAGFSDIDQEVFVDGGSYEYTVQDGAPRHFRVYAYPEDGKVAYQYPSRPVTVRSP